MNLEIIYQNYMQFAVPFPGEYGSARVTNQLTTLLETSHESGEGGKTLE